MKHYISQVMLYSYIEEQMIKERKRMNGFRIIKSKNFEEMVPMFIEAGLEVRKGEPVPEGLLVCFEVIEEKSGRRIGGAALTYEHGEYVIRTVAVEKSYQGQGIGKWLVQRILDEAREWEARQVVLNAKLPSFYKKLGFTVMKREEAPPISECYTCPRFGKDCYPEIMRRKLV